MLIAEELLLLALDDRTGKLRLSSDQLDPALGGALLAELALMERIGVTSPTETRGRRGRITITDVRPTDDAVLDEALAKVVAHEGEPVKDLLSSLASSKVRITHELRDRLLERLAATGALVRDERTVLGFIPVTSWPTGDPGGEDDVRRRLQSALVGGQTPAERTVALIALLQVIGLLERVVHTDDRTTLRARAEELTTGSWAAEGVKAAIDEVATLMVVLMI